MAASTVSASRSSSQASTYSSNSNSNSSSSSSSSSGGRAGSTRSKQPSLAHISVRSFSDFRAQTSSIPSPNSVRRKPLPANASPQLSCFSPTETHRSEFEASSRPRSLESRSSKQVPGPCAPAGPASKEQGKGQDPSSSAIPTAKEQRARADGTYQSGRHISSQHNQTHTAAHFTPSNGGTSETSARGRETTHPYGTLPPPLKQDQDINGRHAQRSFLTRAPTSTSSTSKNDSSRPPQPKKSDMSIWADGLPRSASDNSIGSTHTISPSKQPPNKFTSFFGWKSSPRVGPESPGTPFTDRSASPSPFSSSKNQALDRSESAPRLNPPAAIDTRAANGAHMLFNGSPTAHGTLPSSATSAHFDVLEKELKEVSSELASSIRREMELEDEIDRFKGEPSLYPNEMARRTSDYFSDSGSSAAKVSASDMEMRIETLEKAKRKLEQEKASIRAEYSTKLAAELKRRHALEVYIDNLQNEMSDSRAQAAAGADSKEKIRELETFLEETRRRLAQERQSRDNFEDLLAALRAELTQMRNERDNLVEEVVPQLKAQIEGLEHENTRMAQEYCYATPNRSRVNSIVEDVPVSTPFRMGGLIRSTSVFNNMPGSGLRRGNSTMNRSASVKARNMDSNEVKEIEDQRNALHKCLRNLLIRHKAQQQEHARAIRRLKAEHEAVASSTPRRKNFARNVATMKEEITTLRRRVDEALTQKWQCEDSLGGVKMALDRAEQETRSLRNLLGSPRSGAGRKDSDGLGISITSPGGSDDSASMVKILRRSIQLAETERDAARREAEGYRQKAHGLQDNNLAEELLDSATRLDELAGQLHETVQRNIDLRERLAAAIEKGENEQNLSTVKITQVQSRLKAFEDSLVSAQQETESTFAANEEVAKSTDAKNTPHLKRLTLSIPGPTYTGHRAGEGIFTARSPRLDMTRDGKAESMNDATKTAVLEKRVADLEKALLEADTDMKGVVDRVEQSRKEIAALQGERESANQGMKKLQTAISQEKQRALRLIIPT